MTWEPMRLVIGNADDMLRAADELALLKDRRQRAREAGYDEPVDRGGHAPAVRAIEAAIEVATRVKITDDIVLAAVEEASGAMTMSEAHVAIEAAFRAAGFEVIE